MTRQRSSLLFAVSALSAGIIVAALGGFLAHTGHHLLLNEKGSLISIQNTPLAFLAADTAEADLNPRIDIGMLSENNFTPPAVGKMIEANLEKMEVKMYEDGRLVDTIRIVSKGRPESAWETPAGIYSIQTKENNHFSSIGEVWMPYSMQFFGNFFIHGWPYYADGTPVGEGYSGGCIRLETADAEKVFAFAQHGTPLVVLGASVPEDAELKSYFFKDPKKKLSGVTARNYLVADLETGDIILEKARRESRPLASITKLMTALVSLETINQFKHTTVTEKAARTYGDAGNLIVGESIKTGDLIYPLLLESSNDAAELLAEYYGRDRFLKQMNARAKSMGLKGTYFEDASGLSQNNVSSAEDIMTLARYLYRNKNFVFDVTKKPEFKSENHTWYNISKFYKDDGYLGSRNGYTDEADHTLLVLFALPLSEFEERNIGIVIMGSGNKEEDARAILEYLKENVYYAENAREALARREGLNTP